MAEPKKPTGATQQAGPEEPTRYIEQQPMGAGEGEEEYVPSFEYAQVEVAEGEDPDYEYVPSFEYGDRAAEVAPEE